MVTDIPTTSTKTSLPPWARLAINRCNLPPQILGSLSFQQHPMDITIDGVADLHQDLYDHLSAIGTSKERAQRFMDYMTVHFTLESLSEAGAGKASKRQRADYIRLIRGWLFDTESREAAVLKGWVESRFGLMTRYHGTKLPRADSEAYTNFAAERGYGLFNTNGLEAQLDLLYSYCQYEWQRRREDLTHLTLYRGINHIEDCDVLERPDRKRATVVLNSLNSFSKSPERAGEFGDIIFRCVIPKQKVLFHEGLLPGRLQGEQEYLVIGGAYNVFIVT